VPKTVLLVDDDALFRMVIGDGLRAAGYTVADACDGLEALQRVREAPPDFILLDLIMPKLDGVRTCRLLKQNPDQRNIPVILLTGVGREGLKALGELGAEAAVAKRQAGATLAEVLQTLRLLESAHRKPPPLPEAAPEVAERRIVTELLGERQHTQTLLDSLGEGIVELDDQGRGVYLNRSALALLDRPEHAILGRPGADLLGAANGPALEAALQEIQEAAQGHTVRLELPYAQKTLGVTLSPLPREGPPGALLVLRDVTEEARRARSLQALAAVGRHILGNLALPALLREIVACAADLLGVERCGLFQIEQAEDQLRLRCMQAVGLSEHYARDLYLAPGEAAVGKALAERQAVCTPDLLRDPDIHLSPALRALVQEEGIGAVLAAPILLAGEAFGALTVYRPAGHRFTPEEVELATSLAGSAAIAIQNARLFEAMRQREEHLRALLETNKKIGSLVPMDALLVSIAEEAARVLRVDAAGFRLVEGDHLILAGVTEEAREAMRTQRLQGGESLSGWVVTHGRPLVVADIVQDPRLIEDHREAARRLGHRAFLGVPLRVGERVIGALDFRAKGARQFTEEDVQLAAAFADQAAIAIENARLYEAAERSAARLKRLNALSQVVASSLDRQPVFEYVVRSATALIEDSLATLWILDEAAGELRREAALGLQHPDQHPETRLSVGTSLVGEVAARGHPLIVRDIQADPRFSNADWARAEGVHAYAGVPLLCEGRCLGVLSVLGRFRRRFTEEELEVLTSLAGHAAIALEKARLYAQAVKTAEESAALHDVGKTITESLDLDATLRRIAESARLLGGADRSYIWLAAPEDGSLRAEIAVGSGAEAFRGTRVPAGSPAASARAVREKRLVAVENTLGSADHDPELSARLSNAALLAVPLRFQDAVGGALVCGYDQPRTFTPAELDRLQGMAHHAAIAIEHARLYAEARKAYEELKTAQDQLVQVEKLRALGEMAGGMAHDFNNALAAILSRAQILRMTEPDPELNRHLEVIEQAALDGAATVRRILGFARGRGAPDDEPVDLGALLPEVLEVTRPRWKDESQGRGAAIEALLALEPVPVVRGNAAELREALINLVFNAIDAMPQGGRLTLGTRRPAPAARAKGPEGVEGDAPGDTTKGLAECVEVFVQDSGVGMPAEVHRRAFEPFFSTKGTRGSGLGLAMVYGTAQRHGGEVLLESQEGKGTTVRLRLPIDARPPADGGEAAPVPAARPGRIVLVDDEEVLAQNLAELLRLHHHEVAAFTDPGRALEHLAGQPADLLFTDLGMPELSGWEVARRARILQEDLPVILVTGWGDQIDPAQVQAHRVHEVVTKPYRAEEIFRVVAALLPASPAADGAPRTGNGREPRASSRLEPDDARMEAPANRGGEPSDAEEGPIAQQE
jgi:GAF domain-containing protein/CheY-like chemotaxis protein